ncbi:MAG: outer membrane protein assembly factor BamE, partial [Aquaspirillum sp.]
MRILLSVCLAAVLGGCSISQLPTWLSPHAIDIQQGNAITQDQVDKLRPGMTRQQVQAIVGTPLLKDMFHANRWD